MTDAEREAKKRELLNSRLQLGFLEERAALLKQEILRQEWALRASEPRNEVAEDTTERKPIRRPFL